MAQFERCKIIIVPVELHTLHCNASRETMLNFKQIKMFFTRKENKIEELKIKAIY